MGLKMAKKVTSFSVEEKIYNEYKKRCDKKGWIMSKQIENFMLQETKNMKKTNPSK